MPTGIVYRTLDRELDHARECASVLGYRSVRPLPREPASTPATLRAWFMRVIKSFVRLAMPSTLTADRFVPPVLYR